MMKNKILCTVAVLALTGPLAHAGGDAAAGKAKASACNACHGENGISAAPIYPNIGGQYENYLLHSLKAYKSGERQNAIMQGMVAALSEQDMKDLAAHFAGLEGALRVGSVNP